MQTAQPGQRQESPSNRHSQGVALSHRLCLRSWFVFVARPIVWAKARKINRTIATGTMIAGGDTIDWRHPDPGTRRRA